MSVGEIQAGKCLKEEDATWGTVPNICILDSGRQICATESLVILRPFLVKPFVTIAMVAFNQFQLSLSNALRRQITEFSCSCLTEASKMRCIKMVGNSLWSHCSSCSSPDPSHVPPAEAYSGSTTIYPAPVFPSSVVSLIPSRPCRSLLSLRMLQLSWACKSEDLYSSNSDSKETGVGDEELWAVRGQLRQEKVIKQQSWGNTPYEVSDVVSGHP